MWGYFFMKKSTYLLGYMPFSHKRRQYENTKNSVPTMIIPQIKTFSKKIENMY